MSERKRRRRWLVISDLQMPFEAARALPFCRAVVREFGISPDNILNVGDETDQYFGGMWEKDPDATDTPTGEIKRTLDKLKAWYSAFPKMRLAKSNHGSRWERKAFSAQIPSILMKKYQEVIKAPDGWQWADYWEIKAAHPFRVMHGIGYEGQLGFRNAAINLGMSVVMGHAVVGGIAHIRTPGLSRWGMCVGCLIDRSAYAFHYAKNDRWAPFLGVGVVIDDGKTPILLPYERF